MNHSPSPFSSQNIEKLIRQTIAEVEQLHHTIRLIQSVSGIGHVTATALRVGLAAKPNVGCSNYFLICSSIQLKHSLLSIIDHE